MHADANFLLLALSLERRYYFCGREPLSIESNSWHQNIFYLKPALFLVNCAGHSCSCLQRNSSPNVSCGMSFGKTWLCGANNLPLRTPLLRSWCNDLLDLGGGSSYCDCQQQCHLLPTRSHFKPISIWFCMSLAQQIMRVLSFSLHIYHCGGPFWNARLNACSMAGLSAVKVTSRQTNFAD